MGEVPLGEGSGEGARRHPQKIFYFLFALKTEHFGTIFKLDLTEETRTSIRQEEAIATPMFVCLCVSVCLYLCLCVGVSMCV